jgi:hypothetical protein
MPALRRVPGNQAGPDAVGILLPPGGRTVLIVRPRVLPWDLLLVQGIAGIAFRELSPTEAPGVAEAFFRALDDWNQGGPGHVGAAATSLPRVGERAREGSDTQRATAPGGYLVWADVGDFALVACERLPGQPYMPRTFLIEEEARQAATQIGMALCPAGPVQRDVYFNTRHFAR